MMGKPRKTPSKTLINNNNNNASLSLSLLKEVEPEILKGLPIKTLLQLRSVSKNWQSIIDNPSFAHTHFSNAETRLGGSRILLSFSNSDGSRYYLYSVGVFGGRAIHHLTLPSANYNDNDNDNDALLGRSKCYFLPPVKGLVCFLNGKNVFVCNPSTRKFRTLPLCPTNYNKTFQNSYFYKPYSSYSFGYDSCSNVFKILHVSGTICRDDNRLYDVESRIITIKTPDEFRLDSFSWRKTVSSFPYPYPFRTQGVFVNGCIYWVGLRAPGEENIVSFDLKEEKFRLISSPSNGVPSSSKLVNIGEKLGIIKTYGDFSLEVLVYTNSTWVKIDVGSHVALKKKGGMSTNFAAFVGNDYTGAMLLTPGVLLHNFVLRSLNGGRERGIKISGLPGWIDFLDYKKINYSVYSYVESIVPLDLVIRLGDFAVDLANVKLAKLMPRLEVEMCKEWKSGDLVFGDVEKFGKKKKEELVKKSYAEASAKRLKKERKMHSGDKFKRK